MTRRRLDTELVRRALVPSRSLAQRAIAEGRVLVGGAPATSATRMVAPDESVHVEAPKHPYVGRGGVKLAAALDAFPVTVAGKRWLDAGASTGGFTDCLLQRGARQVVAVDVGHNQLAWSLRTDARVVVHEKTNVRGLTPDDIGGPVDGCVADLSFISLRTVVPAILGLLDPAGDRDVVALVKPQFEAGRERLPRGGVVRDPQVHADVLVEVVTEIGAAGLGTRAAIASPIHGADGNREFLVWARPGPVEITPEALTVVAFDQNDPR